MKLNKILALALSGVMAVSMLAGCSDNGGKDEGEVVVNPTTNAVTVMNNQQDTVEFKADTTLDSVLKAAVSGLYSKDIKDAPETVTLVSNTNSELYKAVSNKIAGAYSLNYSAMSFTNQPTFKKDTTVTNLYWIKAANLSEESVLTLVANEMEMNSYATYGESGGKGYVVDYDGAVSIVKATATAEDGKTYNTYVVAVSVTQSYGDQIKK